jgi:hypothetical protein
MERRDLLEISPYQADGGELIGKHPGDVPPDFLSLKFRTQNPLKAIREKCLYCCCGNSAEVRNASWTIVPYGRFACALIHSARSVSLVPLRSTKGSNA